MFFYGNYIFKCYLFIISDIWIMAFIPLFILSFAFYYRYLLMIPRSNHTQFQSTFIQIPVGPVFFVVLARANLQLQQRTNQEI